APIVLPEAGRMGAVEVFRDVGPLAMIVLSLVIVLAGAILLIALFRKEGFQIVTLIVAVALLASFAIRPATATPTATFAIALFRRVAVAAGLTRRWHLVGLSLVFIVLTASFAWRSGPQLSTAGLSVGQPAPATATEGTKASAAKDKDQDKDADKDSL